VVAAIALSIARKSSPVPTKNPLCELATMSVNFPPASMKRMDIPRGAALGAVSGISGTPVPSENRTVTGTAPPFRWAALLVAFAPGAGVKVPVQTIPLACAKR
jgi:hypothetical protein